MMMIGSVSAKPREGFRFVLCVWLSLLLVPVLDAQNTAYSGFMLAGTEQGLFGVDLQGRAVAFRGAGSVRKITQAPGVWAILGSEGIFVSSDLQYWEKRSAGLPVKTIKLFQNGSKSFLPVLQEIKDVRINPGNTNIMVCATKDVVYLSRDQGRSWINLGAPPYRTNGIKAVCVVDLPAANGFHTPTVFMAHSVYGIHYIQPDRPGASWTELKNGIETLESTDNPDELSDLAIANVGGGEVEIYVSQTFRRRIYRLNWERKAFSMVWSDNAPFGTVDSLGVGADNLRFLMEETVAEVDYTSIRAGTRTQLRRRTDLLASIRSIENTVGQKPYCIALRDSSRQNEIVVFNELWLILGSVHEYNRRAENKEGVYMPVHHAKDVRLNRYFDLMSNRKLNMVVIDMKDDYGRLHFTPQNPAITEKGRVFQPLDIDTLLRDFKSRGIYTVARIVVFKDPVLASREGGRYAVWDRSTGRPWLGYYDKRQSKGTGSPEDSGHETIILPSNDPESEILRTYYDERWVDPYSEEVWEYTAAVAVELYERGFDEIQFDYIRFPTDGENLANAQFRWQDSGMDRESAILSFLRHIRGRVKAPISIDIYGANGWYRTGARTGQEVEQLAPWVDVICPMYYPSHFEQNFLAQAPAELRPWRIYYLGTLRTARIGRGQIIVRPYVQAFNLNVSYDRRYYGLEYVRQEVRGVREAGRGGLTYWNNIGRYDDIPLPE